MVTSCLINSNEFGNLVQVYVNGVQIDADHLYPLHVTHEASLQTPHFKAFVLCATNSHQLTV